MYSFILILVLIQQSHSWTQCGSKGNWCHINNPKIQNYGNITKTYGLPHAIARYGSGLQWSYRYFQINAFLCDTSYFGDPCVGAECPTTPSCAYLQLSPDDYWGDAPNGEEHHTWIYQDGETIQSTDNDIHKVEYGGTLTPTYFFVIGSVLCSSSTFYPNPSEYENGALVPSGKPSCWYNMHWKYSVQFTNWTSCATEGQMCYFPNAFNVYSVAFGSADYAYGSQPSAIIRDVSGKGVICDTRFFSNVNVYPTHFPSAPRFCMYAIRTQFQNPVGYWKQVGYCYNCKQYQQTLTVGVSSMNQDATSETWTDTLIMSTSSGVKFGFFSNSETLTDQQSHSVTETSMHAYTIMASKTCSATCSGDGPLYVFQWMINIDERCADHYCPTVINTCVFLCQSSSKEPTCIPSEC